MSRFRSGKPPKAVAVLERWMAASMVIGVILDLITKSFGTELPVCTAVCVFMGCAAGLYHKKLILKKEREEKEAKKSPK